MSLEGKALRRAENAEKILRRALKLIEKDLYGVGIEIAEAERLIRSIEIHFRNYPA